MKIGVEKMVKCPNCGEEADTNFCPNCGEKLESEITCPHCQSKVEAGSLFCSECGKKIEQDEKETPAKKDKKEEDKKTEDKDSKKEKDEKTSDKKESKDKKEKTGIVATGDIIQFAINNETKEYIFSINNQ